MLKNKFGKKAVAAVMAAAMTVSATAMGLSSITASVINMPIAVTSIIINPSENLKPAVTYSSSLSDVTAFSLVSFVSASSLFIIFENSSASPFAALAAILTLLIKPSIYTEI